MYVYIQSEGHRPGDVHDLFTVGFYDPNGDWQPESDHSTRDEAAKRVNYLNGDKDDNNKVVKTRKVKFKKWIPIVMVEKEPGIKKPKEGTGRFDDFATNGLFHQWASAYEEFDEGAGNYTAALVELEDGTIEEVPPTSIKFEDKP